VKVRSPPDFHFGNMTVTFVFRRITANLLVDTQHKENHLCSSNHIFLYARINVNPPAFAQMTYKASKQSTADIIIDQWVTNEARIMSYCFPRVASHIGTFV